MQLKVILTKPQAEEELLSGSQRRSYDFSSGAGLQVLRGAQKFLTCLPFFGHANFWMEKPSYNTEITYVWDLDSPQQKKFS